LSKEQKKHQVTKVLAQQRFKVQAGQTIHTSTPLVYSTRGSAREGAGTPPLAALMGTWRFSSVPRVLPPSFSCCKATMRSDAYVSEQQTRIQDKVANTCNKLLRSRVLRHGSFRVSARLTFDSKEGQTWQQDALPSLCLCLLSSLAPSLGIQTSLRAVNQHLPPCSPSSPCHHASPERIYGRGQCSRSGHVVAQYPRSVRTPTRPVKTPNQTRHQHLLRGQRRSQSPSSMALSK
jgi:hypothetical protein